MARCHRDAVRGEVGTADAPRRLDWDGRQKFAKKKKGKEEGQPKDRH